MSAPALRPRLDPTTSYARDVVDGHVVAGKPVVWACQRHLDDLDDAHGRGLWFDHAAADHAFRFFGLLRHFEGELGKGAGQPFRLEPWQYFILGCVFGWKRDDGTRRFREAWVRVARKNGKSFLAAGVGNYLLTVDGEPGAQIYSAASKRDQARVIHRAAIAQRDKSPELRRLVTKFRDRLVVPGTRSFFAPLGADSDTEDGLNPHGATLDEIHAHKDGGMWDVLESGMGARRQPLIFATTTAGTGASSFGRLQDAYYRRVVDPDSGVTNDNAFAYIAELDEGDDPYAEANWLKPNPNLGVSVNWEFLRGRAAKAKESPRVEADFFVKNLDMWLQGEERWLSSEKWDNARTKLSRDAFRASLKGRPCFAALDLSSTTDLTALALFFPAMADKPCATIVQFFYPVQNLEELQSSERRDRASYGEWIKAGWIETTPTKRVDQDHVKRRLRELAAEFQFSRNPVALDRKFTEKLAPELEAERYKLRQFPQTYSAFTGPCLTLEALLEEGRIEHDGNPVLRWNAGNAVLKKGGEGEDCMPSKRRSPERIDGIVALLMALGTAGAQPPVITATPVHHNLPASRGGGKRAIFKVFT